MFLQRKNVFSKGKEKGNKMEQKDKAILSLLKKQPDAGMCQLIDEYGAAVKTICKHILRNCDQGLVEDVMQESFLRFWRNISEGKKIKKSVKAYLYQITRNCALDYLRQNQRQKTLSIEEMEYEGVEELVTETAANVEETFARKHNYRLVHEAINEMKEPNRTMFIRYFYNFTMREIAEQMQLKEDRVESRLRRDKKKLQKILLGRGVFYEAGETFSHRYLG